MARHTLVHLLHDAGAAAWFGGSLMGATSLNAAAAQLSDPSDRTRVSTAGWSRWAPVNGAAVLAHLAGAAALTRTDASRVALQQGMGRSTAVKTAVTAAGVGVAAWSTVLNRKMAAAGPVPAQGATEPSSSTPAEVAAVQRQLKIVQWLNPLVSGAIIVTGASHSCPSPAASGGPSDGALKRRLCERSCRPAAGARRWREAGGLHGIKIRVG